MVAVPLTGSVGEKAKPGTKPNQANDVRSVQDLLNKAFGRTVVPVNGICGPDTIKAIKDFQSFWPGTPDGSVWPAGHTDGTLKRLDRMANPLKLNIIGTKDIAQGGFSVSYQTSDGGRLPALVKPPARGYCVYLTIGNDVNLLDITDRNPGDVVGADNLEAFLMCVQELNNWASDVPCRLVVKFREGPTRENVVSRSDVPRMWKTPVKPHSGKLGRELLKSANVGDWTYGALEADGGDGRFLWTTPFNDKYYFAYGGRFETNPKLRGLVCITYIGAVYKVGAREQVKNTWQFHKDDKGKFPATIDVMSAYGTQLAVHLNATQVGMEGKKAKDLKEFFKANQTGCYMMWKEGHSVLVIDGKVHEFTNAHGADKGHHEWDAVNETDSTREYGYGNAVWWVRQLKEPPS